MVTVTIPKNITKGEELVVIPRREYEKFLAFVVKHETVGEADILRWSKEAKKLYKIGKLPTLHSLKDLSYLN